MTQHTPGPWEVDNFGHVKRHARIVADVSIPFMPGSEQQEGRANARLIAAAPALLKIAERAEYLATLARMVPTDQKLLDAAAAMFVDARAVVALARGEQVPA